MKALGADKVLCYDKINVADIKNQYDAVFDTLGGEQTIQAFAQIKTGGVVISVAGPPDIEMREKFGSNFITRFFMWMMARKVYAAANAKNARYYRYLTESNGEQLSHITTLVDQGKIKPVIDAVLPLEEAAQGLKLIESREVFGKVVICP